MKPDLPLRDIHLPEPIGWWPPAPGWWLLLFGALALVSLAVWLWRRWRRVTVQKLALSELEAIERDVADAREQMQRLAILLRRVCLSAYPREEVAGLTGAAWLSFLDRQVGGHRFSEGVGRLLLEAPYRREIEADAASLLALCREWLIRLPAAGQPNGVNARAVKR